MADRVITLYSYKGGVGRSFAVANIAVIMAQWGYRVLVVDFDIEAPGLNHYFAPFKNSAKAGVLDFVQDCRRRKPSGWNYYAGKVAISDLAGELYLMPAAAGGGGDYTSVVQALDWDALYRNHDLGRHFERLRSEWMSEFDAILIDSRTGLTDFSGLTTVQLPDVLAFLFTANAQSLDGSVNIVGRAMEARRQLPVDRPALLPLPIPARFEQREEYDRAQFWRGRFATQLQPFYETWAPTGTDLLKLIDILTIPYVPRWTFGEEIAALIELPGSSGTRTPGQAASYACETLAALLVQEFAQVHLLTSSRDEFVHAARIKARDRKERFGRKKVFISYSHADRAAALKVRDLIKKMPGSNLEAVIDVDFIKPGAEWITRIRNEIEEASAYVIIVGSRFSSRAVQRDEVEWVLRQTVRSQQPKVIIPVVIPGGEIPFSSSKLANFQPVAMNPDREPPKQLTAALERIGRASPNAVDN